jgi:hypothetical protein
MRKQILTVLSVALLTLGTACGSDDSGDKVGSDAGFSADEKKAAKALRDDLNQGQTEPSKAQKAAATCTANQIIDEVGTKKLVDAGLMTEDFEIKQATGAKIDKDLAQGIATAIVGCQDIEAEAEEDRDAFPKATDEQFDTYVDCMEDIDADTLETAIVDSMTGNQSSTAMQDYTTEAEKCRKPLGEPQAPSQ